MFSEEGDAGSSPPKDEGWVRQASKCTQKAIEAVKAIVVSVLGAILSFLKKRWLDLLMRMNGP